MRIDLTPIDNGALAVTCPLLPEVYAEGADEAEALREAADAIALAVADRIAAGREIPRPPSDPCHHSVRLPALTSAKVALAWALQDAGLTRADLCRRMRCGRKQVDRLLDLEHATRLDQLEQAFRMLGRELHLEVC